MYTQIDAFGGNRLALGLMPMCQKEKRKKKKSWWLKDKTYMQVRLIADISKHITNFLERTPLIDLYKEKWQSINVENLKEEKECPTIHVDIWSV